VNRLACIDPKAAEYTLRLQQLVQLIIDLKEKQCMQQLDDMLSAGWAPNDLLDSCIQGMQQVGQRFIDGRYFISALIMAGVIMRQATELLEPHLKRRTTSQITGTLLLGTIAGDIHDLGKNLFAILARYGGIQIIDLGVDVSVDTFISQAQKNHPQIVGISCILTTALPELKNTIQEIRKNLTPPIPKIIIGGSCMDELICRHVSADFWVRDASQGVSICHQIMQANVS
jgi:methanogenic corrinoid protein MtbC1